jgi:hypothetical protein
MLDKDIIVFAWIKRNNTSSIAGMYKTLKIRYSGNRQGDYRNRDIRIKNGNRFNELKFFY